MTSVAKVIETSRKGSFTLHSTSFLHPSQLAATTTSTGIRAGPKGILSYYCSKLCNTTDTFLITFSSFLITLPADLFLAMLPWSTYDAEVGLGFTIPLRGNIKLLGKRKGAGVPLPFLFQKCQLIH